ncbi:MAG: competence/damage-inducible protein A [Ruminococcaceae bacterium]|nr:competence/damage-inducible protein A [Oscillospiraceae bacterium]
MEERINVTEILCVGTELLLGDIVNTNAAFLSGELAKLGFAVYHHSVVGDNPERLKGALELSLSRSDLVVMSGGLGPTKDDLTKETVAQYFGLPLEMDSECLDGIREYFAMTGRVMSENNEKQAMIPRGARVLRNRYGTAPSIAVSEGGKTVIMLPGPPVELIPIFHEEVIPYLRERSGYAIVSKNVNIFGMGESAVAQRLDRLLTESQNPTVAPYCKEGEVRLRVTAKAENETMALEMCDTVVDEILASEVGPLVYGIDADSMERVLVDLLHEKKLTLSAAESCTGGLIAKRITDIAGCSDVFFGGCVTYTNEVKQRLLGVSAKTLEDYGAVSEQTAMEMARGVRERTGSDIGISATGIAGPSGGSEQTPVGTVFLGISTEDGEAFRRLSLSPKRSREFIRIVSATNAYDMVIKWIKNKK